MVECGHGAQSPKHRRKFLEVPLILASKSPRRAKILRGLGLDFTVLVTEAEEVSLPREPEHTVVANATLKLEAARRVRPDAAVLAADTIVWYADRIYGKPRDLDEARRTLRELSGRVHTVFTGVAFALPGGETLTATARSDVKFRELSDELIERYVALVNPLDRAGSYDIDDYGQIVVESYTGSYENIMGLPVEPVRSWCRAPAAAG